MAGLPMNYRECEGIKGGKLFTNGDGYFYCKNFKRGPAYQHLVCKQQRCRGTAKIQFNMTGVSIVLCSAHSAGCEPDVDFEKEINLRKRILSRCEEETTPLARIFQEECNREQPTIAARLTYPQILSSMKRSRKKVMPPIPNTYQHYEELLEGQYEDSDGTKYFYKRIGEEETESVVFIVKPLETTLCEAKEIHLDGTFKIVPNVPSSRQLFTILAMKHDHAFPVVFALMKSKSAEAYRVILNFLKEKYPVMNPQLVISDYEAGIKVAVKQVFPDVTHKGCWFHYSQCIFRRIQLLGMQNVYKENASVKKSVKMLMALALMPSHLIERGFNDVIAYAQDIRDTMEPVFTYFKSQWMDIVGVESFSVYGQPRRTNNDNESFHRMLFNLIGKSHPNIWEFTAALKGISGSAVRDHVRIMERGVATTIARKKKWVLQDFRIQDCQTSLLLGHIQPIEFLSAMSHRLSSECTQTLNTVGDDVDDTLAPLPDTMAVHTVPPSEDNEDVVAIPPAVTVRGRNRGRGRGRRGRGRVPEQLHDLDEDVNVLPEIPIANEDRGRDGDQARRGRQRGRGRRGGRGGGVNVVEDLDENVNVLPDIPIVNEDRGHDGDQARRGRQRGRGGRGGPGGGVNVVEDAVLQPSPYGNYRIVPTMQQSNEFMALEEVIRQKEELNMGLQVSAEPEVECDEDDPSSCSACKCSRATRICSPCGHEVLCYGCAVTFVNIENFHRVTAFDGSIVQTHIRLPLTCPTCRAIIGQLIRVYGNNS